METAGHSKHISITQCHTRPPPLVFTPRSKCQQRTNWSAWSMAFTRRKKKRGEVKEEEGKERRRIEEEGGRGRRRREGKKKKKREGRREDKWGEVRQLKEYDES